jgi:hypothetical protein
LRTIPASHQTGTTPPPPAAATAFDSLGKPPTTVRGTSASMNKLRNSVGVARKNKLGCDMETAKLSVPNS